MTERSEQNLTDVLEHTGKAYYERGRTRANAEGATLPPWEEVPAYDKQQLKQALLPMVMDVLDHEDAHAPTEVHIVSDTEGERCEVYLDHGTALERVSEINARMGEGWAFEDTRSLLPAGGRPTHPHHGI